MSTPFRVIFMGTSHFSVPSFKALHENPDIAKIVAVYTQPDKPSGRGLQVQPPIIKDLALKLDYPVYQPDNINTPEQKKIISSHIADLIVVVSFAQFLSEGVLNLPRCGCINVHASLLPKYRGASPIQAAILNGEKETGVTIMKLVKKMDAGPILLQKSISIDDTTKASELFEKLSVLGAESLIETLKLLQTSNLNEEPQDESKATYAKLIKKEDAKITWEENGEMILRKIRAFDVWPKAFAESNFGMVKILKANFLKEDLNSNTTKIKDTIKTKSSLKVRCSDGFIEILELQLENKKPMQIGDFLNGFANKDFKFI
jgi:methionyl-tRNA formyltransferase